LGAGEGASFNPVPGFSLIIFVGKGGQVEMPYVIAEPCIGTKDTACVDVCPVDCIHPIKQEGQFEEVDQLYINPETCIDCAACEPACPVEAIFAEESVPDRWRSFIEKNADWYALPAAEFQTKWGAAGRKS